MRSIWKGPLIFKVAFNKNKNTKIMDRKTTIFPCFIGKKFIVKTGKSQTKEVYILEHMVGLKFGSFVFTKKYGKF